MGFRRKGASIYSVGPALTRTSTNFTKILHYLVLYLDQRKKDKEEEKAKVVASVLRTEFM